MENQTILPISDRGQITIPKNIRNKVKANFVICVLEGDSIRLSPLQTRDEFLNELEEAHADWKKNGGTDLATMKKSYGI